MRLSWNEIRARASAFAQEWADAGYEKGEAQTFYNEFFSIFGVTRRRVATFEEPVRKLGNKRGFIDLFWKGVLLVEQKSARRDLKKAKEQALDYFPGLKEAELPRYILLSDFQTFELYDLDEDTEVRFALHDLPRYVEHFVFILGIQKRSFRDQDPVNIKASELMGKLHDALKASGYVGHELERLLVRLIFCFFADVTGIFEPRGIFLELLKGRTREDGSDLGQWLSHLFDVLNTPLEHRQTNLDEDLAQFSYVNGDLFRDRLPVPAFDAGMRKRLIEACEFRWDAISPAIFGSLFQSVMKSKERRAQGAHYTTEKNIIKVIEPLFLDELKSEFERLKVRRDTGRTNALKSFQDRLAALTFFDPACGCGNFLIIAYRELRALEIAVLRELNPKGQRVLDVAALSKIDVNQFYGIEIGEFPARIAEVALWMMDHIMNSRLSLEFGENFARIPLRVSPHIRNEDALELDWDQVLPAARCSFVFGNPPFVGAKYQTAAQRSQVRRLAQLGGSGGTLDYVAAWFLKAAAYVRGGRAAIGFVATNSITQGEQVAQLWPSLFQHYALEISFAHRTFAWGSDARGKAHVHVVIVGLVRRDREPPAKRLFSYGDIKGDPVESTHPCLSPYLFDASMLSNRHLVIDEKSRPLSGQAPRMITGTQPIDGGHLIFDLTQRAALLAAEPQAAAFLRPFIGTDEFVNGIGRWILALQQATPQQLRSAPLLRERLRLVSEFRRASKRKSTLKIADYPSKFNVETMPARSFLVIPEVSSENRDYIPIGWLNPPVIPSNKLRLIEDASLWHFGILTSRMHMAWTQIVGGRLESRFQYSVGINYNAFPWPQASATQQARVSSLAQGVLDARALFQGATFAELYDADVMKPELRRAHRALDAAVDKLYRAAPFTGDRERVEFLFSLYEKAVTPLLIQARPARRRAAR